VTKLANGGLLQHSDGETGGQQDEEGKVMTFDEWKSIEEMKRVKTEFNIRKAGEGCSGDPQWKKMYVLSKKEKAEVPEDEEELQVEVHLLLGIFISTPITI